MRKIFALAITLALPLSAVFAAVGGEVIEGKEGAAEDWEETETQAAQEIHDWHDLDNVRNDLESDYVLINDLDENTEGYSDYNTGNGWEPIGPQYNRFSGTFDGNGYEISGLYINRSEEDNLGLFGYTDGAELTDLGLIEVNLSGGNQVGGLVGVNDNTTVNNSYATGSVSGDYDVGGLIGYNTNKSAVSNSYAKGEVSGNSRRVGGLIGMNWNGTVSNSYATVHTSGAEVVGGLVGLTDSAIKNSYAAGNVSGGSTVGGLVGSNINGNISNSYAAGNVSGNGDVGGLVGLSSGTISDSFWDIETSGQDTSQGGTGKTTAEMKEITTYTDTDTSGLEEPWDFVGDPNDDTDDKDIWDIDEDEMIKDGYPFLSWEIRSALTIHIEGGGTVEVDGEEVEDGWTELYENGTTLNITAIPDEGYHFVEWTGDHNGSEEQINITIAENMELTAHFETKMYNLTVGTVGEGSVDVDPDKDEYEHGEEVNLTAVPAEDWYFAEWTGDYIGEEDDLNITIDGDKNITAVFEEHRYTLDVTIEGEGTVDVEPEEDGYEPGTEVNLTAAPADKWYFVNWTGDYTGTEQEITMTMDGDKSLTAHFEEHSYTLDVTVEGGGTVEIDPQQEDYEPGTEVTLTAIPDEGWSFVEWTGTDQTGEEITITMDEDKNITAHFEQVEE
ncbi:MAG: GLUG motif-containing protein, partial [Candidatus Thermoplasmatota archaeon]